MTRMDADHPEWETFLNRLAEELDEDGCDSYSDKPLAASVLSSMSFSRREIGASFRWFEERGGMCDCEILLNVAARDDEVGPRMGDGTVLGV